MPNITELHVNGHTLSVEAEAERSLLSVLRDDLELTGAKYGCGEGQCGACTVLIDGIPTRSCLTQVGTVGQKAVTTIEGLEKNGHLHPVQEAFLKADAMQCAYCTSGMILSAVGLLKKHSRPGRNEIIEWMDGNVCRCGAYQRIIEAIEIAAGGKEGSK